MIDNVCKHIELALTHLRKRDLPPAARLEAFCRALGAALRGMEISPAAALACVRTLRARVELMQALDRPQPVATVRALVLDVLQGEPETAALFEERCALTRAISARRTAGSVLPLTDARAGKAVLPLAFQFTPCPQHRMHDSYRRLDPKSMQHHLRQVGRAPRRPEPPNDFRGMSHV